MQKFDDYITSSTLPIADSGSLCHGLYIGSNFKKLSPKWAVGKLIIESGEFVFKGANKTLDASWLSYDNTKGIHVSKISNSESEGKYYKIDMNNWCRYFFSFAENSFPSKINWGWVEPVEVTCK
ncbi:MAG: hypothetical protein WC875_04065 [Candidatus Absconditabacterales bacterium]